MLEKIKKMAIFFGCFLFFVNILLPYTMRKFYLKDDIISLKHKYISSDKNATQYILKDVQGKIFLFENSSIFGTEIKDIWSKINKNDQLKIRYYELPIQVVEFYPRIIDIEIL